MENLIKKLKIDETFTKPPKKQKIFNKITNNIPPIQYYNYMADLLYLPETTKDKFKYLLVVVDLATGEFDIEPLKNKSSETVLNAFKNMFKRKYIKKPYSSIRTDNGTEFQDVFHKYLYDNNIFHSVSLPYRHSQLSNVEALNKQLGRLFNGYMNSIEQETKKPYTDWIDIIDIVRKELNIIRKKKLPTMKEFAKNHLENTPFYTETPEFKIGDIVNFKLDYPENALGIKQPTANFRVGDYRWSAFPRKIIKIIYMQDKPYYRYVLENMQNVSFSSNQLMKNNKETESKYVVKEIIGKKKLNKKTYYLIWWKGYKKADATYEPEKALIEDGFKDEIDKYNNSI